MSRIVFVVAAVLLIVLTACGNGDESTPTAADSPSSHNDSTVVPVTPVAKPTTVPQTAQPVEQTTTLGRIERRANQEPEAIGTRQLLAAACQDDVLVIETSEETIHAALPCRRFWDRDAEELFLGEQVAIVLEVTEVRFRIFIETPAGAQAEFTVAGIWVE